MTQERGAQAIHRALTVLEAFSVETPSLSLTEISEYAELTVPTTHRMIHAFELRGYIVRDPETGSYSLGSSIMKLAQVVSQRSEVDHLLALATPHMQRLRDVTGETVGLHIRVGRDRVCISELVSHQVVRMETGVGRVVPLHAGAASKALLTGLSKPELATLLEPPLERLAKHTIVDIARLTREVAMVRRVGYAISIGESVSGASGLAAPISGPTGPVAAINIAGPESRWTREAMVRAAPTLLVTTRLISEHLGHSGEAVGAHRPRKSTRVPS